MVRFKNRYLLLELIWKDARIDLSLPEAALLGAFRDSMQSNFGDYGLGTALASLQVKYFNSVTGLCIVRCSREQHRQVVRGLYAYAGKTASLRPPPDLSARVKSDYLMYVDRSGAPSRSSRPYAIECFCCAFCTWAVQREQARLQHSRQKEPGCRLCS